MGCAIAAILLLCGAACEREAPNPESTPYLDATVGFLDTLVEHGTDRYGPVHSPMFSSVLDLQRRVMPPQAPPLLAGQRAADRSYPGGNMQQDMVTLLTMYHMSRWSGDDRFAAAADAYLRFFLDEAPPAGEGLFPAGEHAFWNFRTETLDNPVHEELGVMPPEFLDQLRRLNAPAVDRHIRALRRHIADQERWYWNRHAPMDGSPATEIRAIPRHGGLYLLQWTYLYERTGAAELLEWARRTAEVHWLQRHPVTGNMPYFVEGDAVRVDDPDRAMVVLPHVLAMGVALLQATEILGVEAVPEFGEMGNAYVRSALYGAPHAPAEGVVFLRLQADGSPYEGELPARYAFWDSRYNASGGYGFQGAERFAIQMLNAHRLTGNTEFLEFAQQVWGFYEASDEQQHVILTPGKYAGLLALALDLYDLVGDRAYLVGARRIADRALADLYVDGLFRAASGADYYEAANGPGALALELFRLHLTLTGSAYALPRNYWDP